MTTKRLGIIQSRGLGDLIIALPIASYYRDQGYDIYWPVCEEFVSHMQSVCSWVRWIPVPTDPQGRFFYDEPMIRLKNFRCDDIICLYQSLTGHPEFAARPYFQLQKFDEYKYTLAAVPFVHKWRLGQCIERNTVREQALYDKLVTQDQYYVIHTEGSTYSCEPDLSLIPLEWQQIRITAQTDSVFDWLKIIEGAQAAILIDSVFANLVDQLSIDVDKYWIPRSHIQLSPVLGSTWTILEAPKDSLAAQRIFNSA